MTFSTRHAISAGPFKWRGPDYPYDIPGWGDSSPEDPVEPEELFPNPAYGQQDPWRQP
ncbi:hypothetical protein BOX05_gp48 [Gordonia phage GAL1]|uniref:Uncharacterized protein n=1 Tax=Gordonia phage GAL1 TaxID=1647469 RepID=A0A162E159_9CAUD|nr:hypothetical protein BOX05_gp48 [Gordonia phage GAL1]AKJ72063.1 hypothetical protein GAL1_48 [Gordonia phage GAL1]